MDTSAFAAPPHRGCALHQRARRSPALSSVAPPLPNDDPFMLRVYDGSYGQAGSEIGYLYPRDYFEPVYPNGQQATESITVHLDEYTKSVLHAQAILAQKSVSALVRQWIEERLDEPERVLE